MLLTTHASNDTSRKADALTLGETRSTDAHIVLWGQGSSSQYRDIVRLWVKAACAARATTCAWVTGWHALVALCCTAFAATALASLARAMRSSRWRDKALPVLSWGTACDFAVNGVLVAFSTRAIASRGANARALMQNAALSAVTDAIPAKWRLAVDLFVLFCGAHCLSRLMQTFVLRSRKSMPDGSHRVPQLTSQWWYSVGVAIALWAASAAWSTAMVNGRVHFDGPWLMLAILHYVALQATMVVVNADLPDSSPSPLLSQSPLKAAAAERAPSPCPCGSLLDRPVPAGLQDPLMPNRRVAGTRKRRAYRTECYACALSDGAVCTQALHCRASVGLEAGDTSGPTGSDERANDLSFS